MTIRLANARTAADLKAQGLNGLQIAARMGWSRSYTYELLADPSGEATRARKAKQGGACRDCGATTSYATGGPSERCQPCAARWTRPATRDWILESIVEWNELFGVPPTAVDWNQSMARSAGTPAASRIVERYQATGRPWPSANTLRDHFGSFSEALRVAGFEPLPAKYRWMGREAYEAMLADESVAA